MPTGGDANIPMPKFHGTPQSPGILFGSFDQFDPKMFPQTPGGTFIPPPMMMVEAPDDVSLVAVEKVVINGVAYLVDKETCDVYDFEDGLNEVLDPRPVGRWDQKKERVEIFDL